MVRVGCPVVVLRMARITIRRRRREVPTDMAIRARHAHMRAGQRKWSFAVVEGCGLPRCRCVAGRACGRNPGLGVWRVVCAVVILGVTGITICGRALILASDVA